MINTNNIKKFFKPIQTQRKTVQDDEWGQPQDVWANHVIIQGVIRKTSGSEVFTDQKRSGIAYYRLYCLLNDILPEDRVIYKDKTLVVTAINDVMEFGDLYQVDLYESQV